MVAAMDSAGERWRAIARTLLVILGLNLAVAAAKAAYGWSTGSLAVSSDALHSLLDGISNVVGLVALGYARRPPDDRHPYGYGKAEVVASVAIGAVIAVGAVEFGVSAAQRLIGASTEVVVTASGIGVLVVTLGVNIFISAFEARAARRLKSPILAADAAHTGADVIVTLVVLGSQGLVYAGWSWADAIASLIVLGAILWVAFNIIRDNAQTLLDRAVLNPADIRAVVLGVPGVFGCHRIRTRGLIDAVQLDLHMMVDPDMTLRSAHALSHRVEEALRGTFAQLNDVTIHVEPTGDVEEPL